MKILKLTFKKKWFDMIKSGEKLEEYREIKPYWISRFVDFDNMCFKYYDAIQFFNGAYYSENLPNFTRKLNHIDISIGNEELGAVKGKLYFVSYLGELL